MIKLVGTSPTFPLIYICERISRRPAVLAGGLKLAFLSLEHIACQSKLSIGARLKYFHHLMTVLGVLNQLLLISSDIGKPGLFRFGLSAEFWGFSGRRSLINFGSCGLPRLVL